jgi:hypothetical protein
MCRLTRRRKARASRPSTRSRERPEARFGCNKRRSGPRLDEVRSRPLGPGPRPRGVLCFFRSIRCGPPGRRRPAPACDPRCAGRKCPRAATGGF